MTCDCNCHYGQNEAKCKNCKCNERFRCEHCGMDTRIRNPSGYCDHLYYPEYCEVCKELDSFKKTPKAEEKNPYVVILKTDLRKIQDMATKLQNALDEVLKGI